jgi:hypothetical protein
VAPIGEAVKDGEVHLDNIQAITEDAQRIAADLDRTSGVVTEPAEAAKSAEAANPSPVEVARPVQVKKRIPGTLINARPHSLKEKRSGHP